ncbi:unnamed protein product [Ambrosiozyma monospora]|uniref:Unnamed protein product n=1 Tax=Ambrosiozyma monospora TaxID=43982 RepID=A0A9W7DHV0_AMBMO|nr:unnamed protein product [Ambrosiozyma monospora]
MAADPVKPSAPPPAGAVAGAGPEREKTFFENFRIELGTIYNKEVEPKFDHMFNYIAWHFLDIEAAELRTDAPASYRDRRTKRLQLTDLACGINTILNIQT